MTDDLDISDVLAAAPSGGERVAPTNALERYSNNLEPLIGAVALALRDEGDLSVRLHDATPAQREQINRFRAQLDVLARPIDMRRRALDDAARIAAHKMGDAKELPLPKGRSIEITTPQVDYIVEAMALRTDLLELIDTGALTKAEIDDAITTRITYHVDHRKLNYLRDHRGAAVAAAIAKRRTKPAVDIGRMRVHWPEPLEDV